MLNDRQREVIQQLFDALGNATDCGLLDELAAYIHPDKINEFCDAVANRLNDP